MYFSSPVGVFFVRIQDASPLATVKKRSYFCQRPHGACLGRRSFSESSVAAGHRCGYGNAS